MPDPRPPIAFPALAATLLLVRDHPAYQVLMVERHAANPFGSGALVFPGGKLDAQDEDAAWSGLAQGWDTLEGAERALRICAIRETFEETTVLAARGKAAPASPPLGDAGDQLDRIEARGQVCRREMSFRAMIARFDLELELETLVPFAHWITPEQSPIRFDARFFIAEPPQEQQAACDGFETVGAEWVAPVEALSLADRGLRKLMHPTRISLKLLSEAASAGEAIRAARGRPLTPVRPAMMGGPAVARPGSS